jgi:hypothetical protein
MAMKRISICAALALLLAAGTAHAGLLGDLLYVPGAFDPAKSPPAPDYSQSASWAALPDKTDASDVAPAGATIADPASAPADVFFIHPTTYFSARHWNADVADAKTNADTDSGTIRYQASVFNGCCAVYAPRYRQMTYGGFVEPSADSQAAMALAYSDVKAAFEYYLAHYNHGRPFIIASHSQGSRHAKMLVQELIDGTPLMKQFVAAYIAGNWLDEDWFKSLKDVKVCERADDTGCVLTWSTLGEDADADKQRLAFVASSGLPPEFATHRYVCTNPLTWTTAETLAPASENIGAWVYGLGDAPRPPDPGLVSMRCDDGALFISKPDGFLYRAKVLPGSNYHDYDYQFAYMNIRENAGVRVSAFLRLHPQ